MTDQEIRIRAMEMAISLLCGRMEASDPDAVIRMAAKISAFLKTGPQS